MLDHSALSIVPFLGLLVTYLTANWPILCNWWLFLLRSGRLDVPEQDAGEGTTPPAGQGQMAAATCPACEAAKSVQGPATRPAEAPPRIVERLGRPPEVDTSSHFCPNRDCRYYGWVGLGNIRSNGHPNGSPWRQLECKVCHKTFMETVNTIFYRKQVSAETFRLSLPKPSGEC